LTHMATGPRDAPAESGRRPDHAPIDFMAMISHDLRTPLAAIREALSLLSETAAGQLDERQRRYLSVALEEVDQLNRMIGNIVEAARIDAGKVVLHKDAVDLSELLAAAVNGLSLLIDKRSLVVERTVPPTPATVKGDRDRLLRVFNNLLDNAIKYSPPGGTIRIDIRPLDPHSPVLAEQGITVPARYVAVAIDDSGPGIPPEFLGRIFGKFECVDPHGPGTGLGLAIVRSIVEMHRGKVWVESSPGRGATFRLLLPVGEDS